MAEDIYKKGKHKFAVDVHVDLVKVCYVEAESAYEAEHKVEKEIYGSIRNMEFPCGFEVSDDVEIDASGEELEDGSIQYY